MTVRHRPNVSYLEVVFMSPVGSIVTTAGRAIDDTPEGLPHYRLSLEISSGGATKNGKETMQSFGNEGHVAVFLLATSNGAVIALDSCLRGPKLTSD